MVADHRIGVAFMKSPYLALALGLLALPCAASEPAITPAISAAVSSPRPPADTARDAARKPAELLVFAGIKPGQKIGDFMPGQGYFTRLFSNVVGPTGHVYALVPSELAAKAPKIVEAMNALQADPAYANVSLVVAPTAQTAAPERLDVVWTSQNYHDIYGFFGPDEAAKADRAVYGALKPGGEFIVIDHVAAAGTSDKAPTTLHRIDPETVKAQVLAAGFTLEATSDVLRNPADTHALKVFAPEIRGHTDQFVFKFRKPGV
jgi:predicted methyltransferase